MSAASDRWRDELAAWAIPVELLGAVPDSPYGWPPELWRRMERAQETAEESPTARRLAGFLRDSGTLLDVGAGVGRVSLPFARRGHLVTAVEKNPGMAQALRADVEQLALGVTVVEGAWPDAAGRAGVHDVVVSAHVVYDVAEIAPFLEALDRAARRAVVLEVTPEHPWAPLSPFYRALHGLERPEGPTVAALVEAVEAEVGRAPAMERWVGSRGMRFADRDELLDFYRRRLVLPAGRLPELEVLLTPIIVESEGWLGLALGPSEIVTLWWEA